MIVLVLCDLMPNDFVYYRPLALAREGYAPTIGWGGGTYYRQTYWLLDRVRPVYGGWGDYSPNRTWPEGTEVLDESEVRLEDA